MTYLDAAYEILRQSGEPLHYKEIARRAVEQQLIVPSGKTPEKTMSSRLSTNIKQVDSRFTKTRPSTYALMEWNPASSSAHSTGDVGKESTSKPDLNSVSSGSLSPQTNAMKSSPRSLTPHLPTYTVAVHYIRLLDGLFYDEFRRMEDDIWAQRGNPQDQVNWSEPDEWIAERLDGTSRVLATMLWTKSKGELNPRYTRGPWMMASRHDLLQRNPDGKLEATEKGTRFADDPGGPVAEEIDIYEGLVTLLRMVADSGLARRGDFLPSWSEYLRSETTAQSESTIKSYLYARLQNLLERGFIVRRASHYEITEEGLVHLERFPASIVWRPDEAKSDDDSHQLRRISRRISQSAREELHQYLLQMDPIRFERLVKFLLEEMGYTNVEVTSPAGDGGVDVIGEIEAGISRVREVIQVKRRSKNLSRRVLDELRGSLHRFNAVRGTIITTGGFSRPAKEAAFERGAAPITLIDSERLLDLLTENEIGITHKQTDYTVFDASKLDNLDSFAEQITEPAPDL